MNMYTNIQYIKRNKDVEEISTENVFFSTHKLPLSNIAVYTRFNLSGKEVCCKVLFRDRVQCLRIMHIFE